LAYFGVFIYLALALALAAVASSDVTTLATPFTTEVVAPTAAEPTATPAPTTVVATDTVALATEMTAQPLMLPSVRQIEVKMIGSLSSRKVLRIVSPV
jgi:hypothetical protein